MGVILTILASSTTANGAGVIMFSADSRYDLADFREIHLMQPNGKKHRRILPNYRMKSATISPKGDTIAYLTEYGNALRTLRTDGKQEKHRIVIDGSTNTLQWSPNGRYIAFTFLKVEGFANNYVGLYDVRKKKVVATKRISAVTIFQGITSLSELDWSPDSKYLYIHETGVATFQGISTPVSFSHVVDAKNLRVLIEREGFSGYGFYDKNRILLPLSFSNGPFVIATRHVRNNKKKKLINLGSPLRINAIRTMIPGRALLVQIERFPETFAAGETDIVRVRGKSRYEDLGYDLLKVDVKTKTATYITPQNKSFLAVNHNSNVAVSEEGIAMQYRKRTPSRTFKTDLCWGWVVTIKGTARADRINGTRYSDVIHGLGGNDVISGGPEDDVLCGGHGNDTLVGGAQNDVLSGDSLLNRTDVFGNGQDKLSGGKGQDLLTGENGDDNIRGGPDNDLLAGGTGNDVLDGQSGDRDVIRGGEGRDQCRNYYSETDCE